MSCSPKIEGSNLAILSIVYREGNAQHSQQSYVNTKLSAWMHECEIVSGFNFKVFLLLPDVVEHFIAFLSRDDNNDERKDSHTQPHERGKVVH
mgnify:CR=1 FL=1